ncbi:MAG: RecQ family ATP-dependent DNA helicase [Planctomycetales bacterium]|nr:RecQ family ATP-dependent DNA helicase [Planctomycetales bacterium]
MVFPVTGTADSIAVDPLTQLREALLHYWGYDSFRPLQAEAMRAVIEHRDSVVVLPTGGGKSICFQAPAVTMPGLAVVVSPLISLMKDQVDALVECGIAAACVNSSLPQSELVRVADSVRRGELKLLYVAPERLCTERMLGFLDTANVSFFAIDEAHCISAWGHDFRPEYRMLGQLRERFPRAGVHAYTATATQPVRDDIAKQLGLRRAEQLVGSFDRPNLVYRVVRKHDVLKQVRQVIDSHPGESGIIYCISRREVDDIAEALKRAGYRARAYHAGLSDIDRHKHQDEFLNDDVDIVVATVAFGMGIDKSDVRFVIHTGTPKSLEHYQQETGRAGRDGLDADCWLFWTVGNFMTWRKMLSDLPAAAYKQADESLRLMERYCNSVVCRHRALVEHFGQEYSPRRMDAPSVRDSTSDAAQGQTNTDGRGVHPTESCGACDVCLDQLDFVADAKVLAQKILSCVVRLKESFGAGYVAQVLTGSQDARILENGHDRLSTYGLLKDSPAAHVRDWIEQLAAQEFLVRTGEFNVLAVTPAGWELLRGDAVPRLLRPAAKKTKAARGTRTEAASWEAVDRGLFNVLRDLRRKMAEERHVTPFIVFPEPTLRELARRKPTTLDGFRQIPGIGDKKTAAYGAVVTGAIRAYCNDHGQTIDTAPVSESPTDSHSRTKTRIAEPVEEKAVTTLASKQNAFDMFHEGRTVDEVMSVTNRARSTVNEYLAEFIEQTQLSDPVPWLDQATFQRVQIAVRSVGHEKLKPIFDALEGTVSYDAIRIAVACLRNLPPEDFIDLSSAGANIE